ncbi:hypothetical protein KI688_007883 [Linnemannia hyalina]|uniref:Uncharacterized protein n=1 Tax=Linnemannia hyalina TaxID=64524 RepID=A0A9P8BMN9_9FUNG|nr:hypothetical protein KI688_007883 [Linnemannia hyalina]
MTPLDPSLVFQFPAVRSLILRGPCVLLGVLEFLPNLDMLSFLPSPSFGYGRPTPYTPLPIKSRISSRSFSSASNSSSVSRSSLFLELSQILQDKCPHITRLVLTEPSIMADLATVGQLPTLLHTMPARLVHVEWSLRGRSGEIEREVIQALVLRLELEELSGAGAMDADEEIVMEMFVKSMFIGSQASVPVDVDVEDEVEMSEVSSGVGELPRDESCVSSTVSLVFIVVLDYRVCILRPSISFYYVYRIYVFEWIGAGCGAESETGREAAEGSGTGVRYDRSPFVFGVRLCRFDGFDGFFVRECQGRRLLFLPSNPHHQYPFLFLLIHHHHHLLLRINTIRLHTHTLLKPEPGPEE